MIGKPLAHFTVVEKLGAGGMGEVWRATDSKLGRDVALKMLPAAFATDAERMARFQREAQVLASLNHPHIAAIYGLEEHEDSRLLVLELVEGATLSERLAQGPVPLAEALPLAAQIAEAVECAHESGVVHRDLKPANVKLTTDGRVKVLDFGLAKALEDPATTSGMSGDVVGSPTLSPTLSPSITGALTGANVILGTAAYMSPEQARGQGVDKRADIWAFGVILYEMLTGRRLFDGETVSDTLAAVLKTDPDWDALPDDTPPRIRRLLRRCLARNPKERLRDIGDARLAIQEVLSGTAEEEEPSPGSGAAAPGTAVAPRRPWLLPAVAIVAAAITFAVTSTLDRSASPADGPVRKYSMPYPADTDFARPALAPDASAFAYEVGGHIWIQELATRERRRVGGERNAISPFWSPDGAWVGYAEDKGLWKVRRSGGTPVEIATLSGESSFGGLSNGVWRENGRIFFTTSNDGLFEVSAQGGDPEEIVPVGEGESDFHELADLDGQALAVVVHRAEGYDTIDGIRPDGSRRRIVTYPGDRLYALTWAPTGHLLFRRSGKSDGIWALPVSPATLETTGDPFLVATNATSPSATKDGTLVYTTKIRGGETVLTLVSRSGQVVRTIGDAAAYHPFPSLSPDGKTIAAQIHDGETENIWFMDVERGTRSRFTSGPGDHAWGSWGPGGETFWYFNEVYLDAPEIYVTAANGTGERRVVTFGWLPRVSPDGRWLIHSHPGTGEFQQDILILDLSREGAESQPFVASPAHEWVTDLSPTDPLVAYCTKTSGQYEVHLTTYPEKRGDWPVSTKGGWWPLWRGDGRELYYAVGDSIMAVDVDPGDGRGAPHLSRPQLLFRRTRYSPLTTQFPDGFEVMPDGQTFVLNMEEERTEDEEAPAIVVVQNWIREFER